MKTLTKMLFIVAFITFSNSDLFGQDGFGTGSGKSQESAKTPKSFEHIGCGLRFPFSGRYKKATAVSHSPYRELGQGKMNQIVTGSITYDIGCIELDDPPRRMKKDDLLSVLNSNTKAYLVDSFEYVSLPASSVNGKEIYEFTTINGSLRYIKYILEGNRVSIFVANAEDINGIKEALKFIDSIEHFSVKEIAEKRIKTATQKTLLQSPTIKPPRSDASHNNLKGNIKWVRREAEDVPILIGTVERRIRSDETYDKDGNLLKSFWFQDEGYPTSVKTYGFIDKMRVSVSESIGGSGFGIGFSSGRPKVKLPPADPRFEQRYEHRYDKANRLIEKKVFSNRGLLSRTMTFSYQANRMEEKWIDDKGKLITTERRQYDKNGNEIRYEFWWYDQTDRKIETYDYKKFDKFGNWTERRVVKTIIDRGLNRKRTFNEFRTITYYKK